MRSPLELLIALFAYFRLRFARRRARRLLAEGLPRARALLAEGKPPAPPLPLALRVPGALPPLSGEPGGDYPSLPLGAQAIRNPGRRAPTLLRLRALPPERRALHKLQPAHFGLEANFAPRWESAPLDAGARLAEAATGLLLQHSRVARPVRILPPPPGLAALSLAHFGLDQEARPRAGRSPAPQLALAASVARPLTAPQLTPPAPDLGAARPGLLGLDGDGLPPAAREPPRTTADRAPPPTPGRLLKQRTPPPRAPLAYFDPRAYRIDPRTLQIANEGVLQPQRDVFGSWVHPALFREIIDVRYLEALFRVPPTSFYEWFAWWHDLERDDGSVGARDPVEAKVDDQIWWWMEHNKEQMLIRRDVPKDEKAPEEQEFYKFEYGVAILEREPLSLEGLVIKPSQIESTVREVGTHVSPLPGRTVDEGYFQWRALIHSLDG